MNLSNIVNTISAQEFQQIIKRFSNYSKEQLCSIPIPLFNDEFKKFEPYNIPIVNYNELNLNPQTKKFFSTENLWFENKKLLNFELGNPMSYTLIVKFDEHFHKLFSKNICPGFRNGCSFKEQKPIACQILRKLELKIN